MRANLVAMTLCDETGRRLFEETQLAELGTKSSKALDRVIAAAQRINAVTDEEIEILEGN